MERLYYHHTEGNHFPYITNSPSTFLPGHYLLKLFDMYDTTVYILIENGYLISTIICPLYESSSDLTVGSGTEEDSVSISHVRDLILTRPPWSLQNYCLTGLEPTTLFWACAYSHFSVI